MIRKDLVLLLRCYSSLYFGGGIYWLLIHFNVMSMSSIRFYFNLLSIIPGILVFFVISKIFQKKTILEIPILLILLYIGFVTSVVLGGSIVTRDALSRRYEIR